MESAEKKIERLELAIASLLSIVGEASDMMTILIDDREFLTDEITLMCKEMASSLGKISESSLEEVIGQDISLH